MTGPIKTATIGGVKYNANLFDAKDLGNGKYQLTSKKTKEIMIFPQQSENMPNQVKYTRYGEKVDPSKELGVYTADGDYKYVKVENMTDEQLQSRGITKAPVPRNAEIKLDINDGWIWDDANYTISKVEGLQFKSSKESVSKVTLQDCTNNKIDLAANNTRHYGDSATVRGGSGNEVKMDDEDSAKFIIPNMTSENASGKGTAAQDDYVK